MKICISFYVMVVIVADKLMISQCWLKDNASVLCDKDLHEHVRVYMCVHVLVSGIGVFSLIFEKWLWLDNIAWYCVQW